MNLIEKASDYKQFSNGKYIFVVNNQKVYGNKKETLWDIYIIDKEKTFPDVTDSELANLGNNLSGSGNKIYKFNQSYVINRSTHYPILITRQNRYVRDKEKAAQRQADMKKQYYAAKQQDIENKKTDQKAAIEKVKTIGIDVNNLSKGTKDAKAFQELLWQYGDKNEKIKNHAVYKKFASYRTAGDDGGWDGDIGTNTIAYINALLKSYNLKTYAELIKKLKLSLSQIQNESTNYFKGIGMNIKLKDLLQEQLLKEQDDDFDFDAGFGSGASGSSTTSTTTTKKNTTIAAPSAPEEKSDACSEINKYKNQYYKSNTIDKGEISGPRAVTYDIWKLYTSAADAIRSHFKDEGFWADYKGVNDDEAPAVSWYWGGYFAKSGGKFYDLVYKPYILKAVSLTIKYSKAARECGDDYDRSFFDLFGTSARPYGRNYMILRQAWIDGRKKTYGDTSDDILIIKLEHPKGVSTYTIDTDF